MRLKVTTTVLLVTGVVFMLAWPLVVGHRPPVGSPELKSYVVRFGIYVILSVCIWVSVALGALFTIRQVRKDLGKERANNLRVLLEATSADHKKKDP